MATLAEARAIISADDSKFQAATRRVTSGVSRLANSGASIGKGIGAGAAKAVRGVANIGVSAIKTTAQIGAIASALVGLQLGTEVVSTISTFGTELSKVEALTGATGETFDSLEAKARSLGATTQFSAAQAAGGMAFLAQAGFKANEILASSEAFLNLAAAGGLELAETMDLASNVMSGFSLAADEAGRVADVLAKTASASNTNVSQLGEAFKSVAPVARTLGIDVEQAAAAIGQLGNVGIQGQEAGTALRNIFLRLAAGGSEVEKGVAALGLTLDDLSPSANTVSQIFDKLGDAIESSGVSADEAVAAYSQIFGVRATAAGASLDRLSGSVSDLEAELRNSEGTAARLAKTMQDNLGGDLKATRSAFEEVILAAGDAGLTGALRSSAQRATEFFRELGKSEGFRAGVSGAVNLASTLRDDLGRAFGKVKDTVFDFYTTLNANGALANFQSAVFRVINTLSGLRDFSVNLSLRGLEALSAITPAILDAFNGAWDLFEPIATKSLKAVGKVADSTLGELFRGFATTLDVDLGELFDSFSDLAGTLTGKIGPALENLLTKLGVSLDRVEDLSPAFNRAGAAIGSMITASSQVLSNFTRISDEAIKTGQFSELAGAGLSTGFAKAGNAAIATIKSLGPLIVGSIQFGAAQGWATFFELGESVFMRASVDLEDSLIGAITKVKGFFSGMGSALSTELKPAGDLGPEMSEAMQKVFSAFGDGIKLISLGINNVSKSMAGTMLVEMMDAFAEIAASGPALIISSFEPALAELGKTKLGKILGLDDFNVRGYETIKSELSEQIARLAGADKVRDEAISNWDKGFSELENGITKFGEGLGTAADNMKQKAADIIDDKNKVLEENFSEANKVFNENTPESAIANRVSEIQSKVDNDRFKSDVAEAISTQDKLFYGAISRAENDAFAESVNQSIVKNDAEFGEAYARAKEEIVKGAVGLRNTLVSGAEVAVTDSAGVQSKNTAQVVTHTKTLTAQDAAIKGATDSIVGIGIAAAKAAMEQNSLATVSETISKIAKSSRDFTGLDGVTFGGLDGLAEMQKTGIFDNTTFSGLDALAELNRPDRLAPGASPSLLTGNQVATATTTTATVNPDDDKMKEVGIAQQQMACLRQIKMELKTLNGTSKRTEELLDARLPEKTI